MSYFEDDGLPPTYKATEGDRAHFCAYEAARLAIPKAELLDRPEGFRHIAWNVSTGHRIPCADVYMACGYVAGSSLLNPQWVYAVQTGPICHVWETDRWKRIDTKILLTACCTGTPASS